MIITKLRLQEEHPMIVGSTEWPLEYCDLNVDSYAGHNGYILKSCLGIGPPDFVSIVQGFDSTGLSVYDSVPEKREIIVKVSFDLTSGKTVSELRSGLYKYISRSILVSLMSGANILAQTKGYISKFDTVHFSNDPEILLTISCDYGDFSSPKTVSIPTSVLDSNTPVISYIEGDAPTGLDLHFKSTSASPVNGFTFSNYGKFWHDGSSITNLFDLNFSLIQNDEIFLSTHPDNRRLQLLRSSVYYDLAGYLNAGAVWPRLYPGVNTFTWDVRDSWVDYISSTYTPRFWGV